MLLREDDAGALAIGQPSHAWISGQLARSWGNQRFGSLDPFEQVCLAAEQHDVGWAKRDLEPILNPDTGLPQSFMEVPVEDHLPLFTDGPRALVSQSRYAALLVSLHGWRLYERRDLAKLPTDEADAIRRFLSEQRAFQAALSASLRADEEQVERNSLLIWTWDYLSLALCLKWAPATAKGAPTANGKVDLELTCDEARGVHYVEPWPFATPALTVRCEGRRLDGRFESEAALRDAFANAPWETLELRLERR
jgi:hypothetical protein